MEWSCSQCIYKGEDCPECPFNKEGEFLICGGGIITKIKEE